MENKPALSKIKMRLNKNFIGAILAIVALLVIGFAVTGFLSGRLYVGIKEPRQKVQLTYQVCASDIVQKYNSFSFPLDKKDQAAMAAMVEEITTTSGYANDSTCQAILFSAALENDDVDGMRKSLSAFEKLDSEGKSVDGNLHNTYSTDVMKTSLQETINEKSAGAGQ